MDIRPGTCATHGYRAIIFLFEVFSMTYKGKSMKETEVYIQRVSLDQLDSVIESRLPQGCFLAQDNGTWVAVDNSTGDAWTEEFYTEHEAVCWLCSDVELA